MFWTETSCGRASTRISASVLKIVEKTSGGPARLPRCWSTQALVIAAFISPYAFDRSRVRGLFREDRFYEVFVDCPPETCEQRDPKGHYRKARSGQMASFTGVSAPYEAPPSADLVVPTGELTVNESVERLLGFILERSRLQ